jgi:hypothetical protein
VRLERLGSIEKSNDIIGNRTHDLPACSKELKMLIAEMKGKARLYKEKSILISSFGILC